MIPAWRHCPSQWTLEYTGYLMTEHGILTAKQHMSVLIKMLSLFLVAMPTLKEACSTMLKQTAMGLPCPPYDPQKELMCAVCTK